MKLRKKIIGFLLIIALAALASWYIFFKSEERLKEPAPADFARELESFNRAFKLSLAPSLATGRDKWVEQVAASYQSWRAIAENFKHRQPEAYRKTGAWGEKLEEISRRGERAYEYALQGKDDLARGELEAARKMLREIKIENGQLDLSEEMLLFLQSLEYVAKAPNKKEATAKLSEMKLRFTELKGKAVDSRYDQLIAAFEEKIGIIDKFLEGPDFRRAQEELIPAFLRFYLDYG